MTKKKKKTFLKPPILPLHILLCTNNLLHCYCILLIFGYQFRVTTICYVFASMSQSEALPSALSEDWKMWTF